MENIVVKKTWEDQDFFQIEIDFISKMASCNVITYTTVEEIADLSTKISELIKKPDNLFKWEIGEQGSEHSPLIVICAYEVDKYGHVVLNIKCDILSSISKCIYSCSFPIITELGLLNCFGDSILSMGSSEIGTTVSLL